MKFSLELMKQSMKINYFGIVAAGGEGTRVGAQISKQYIQISGRSLLEISIETLTNSISFSKLAVVIPESDKERCQHLEKKFDKVELVRGGATRCESVLQGLKFLKPIAKDNDWCLVHDAARPCLQKKDILKLIHNLDGSKTGGILGAPVVDTIKKIDKHNRIDHTVKRTNLWRAFTPQMFRYGVLLNSLLSVKKAGIVVSDESQALERLGKPVLVVQGSSENIKVTFPEDVRKAEIFFMERENKES